MKEIDTRNVVDPLIPNLAGYAYRLAFLYKIPNNEKPIKIYPTDNFILQVEFDKYKSGESRLALSCGAFYILYEYIKIFLSDNDIFKGVGRSSGIAKLYSLNIKDYGLSYTNVDSSVMSNDPILFDEKRIELIDFLFAMASRFLIAHEMVHIFDGHTEYLTQLFTEARLIGNEEFKIDPLISQTLEWDADLVASNIAYDWTKTAGSGIPILQADPHLGAYSLSFVTNLLLTLFLNKVSLLSSSDDHPSSAVRTAYIGGHLSKMKYNNDEKNSSVNALHDFWATAQKCFTLCDLSEYKKMFEEDLYMESYASYFAQWKKLVIPLQRHATVDLSD
ncbi:hypothetical protein [Mucilaginibacter sp.]|jgi:hypothetical protein|uniref:hypothetical protein n=1 Tax=Mucilaginibacter sp. TaxID=1882438 RepID=UPI0035629703